MFADSAKLRPVKTKLKVRQYWEQDKKYSEGTRVVLVVVVAVAVMGIDVLAVIYAPRRVVLFYRT